MLMIMWVQDEFIGVCGDVNGVVCGMIIFINGVNFYFIYMINQGMFMICGMQDGIYIMVIDG